MYPLATIRGLSTRGVAPAPWAGKHPCRIYWLFSVTNVFPQEGRSAHTYNGKPSFTASKRLIKLWHEALQQGQAFNVTGYIYDRKNLIISSSFVDQTGWIRPNLWAYYFLNSSPVNRRYIAPDDMILYGNDSCLWPFLNTPLRNRIRRNALERARFPTLTENSRISYQYSSTYCAYGSPHYGYHGLSLPGFLAQEQIHLSL